MTPSQIELSKRQRLGLISGLIAFVLCMIGFWLGGVDQRGAELGWSFFASLGAGLSVGPAFFNASRTWFR